MLVLPVRFRVRRTLRSAWIETAAAKRGINRLVVALFWVRGLKHMSAPFLRLTLRRTLRSAWIETRPGKYRQQSAAVALFGVRGLKHHRDRSYVQYGTVAFCWVRGLKHR